MAIVREAYGSHCTHLQAIANPENVDTKPKDVRIDVGGIMIINRIRRTREYDTYEGRL
jgi:hypothetical protein